MMYVIFLINSVDCVNCLCLSGVIDLRNKG